MATVVYHGQCSSRVPLGQPLPTSTQGKHTLGKRRVPLRKRVVLHHAVRVQSRAGFGRGTVKIKEEKIQNESEPEPEGGTKKVIKLPGPVKLQGTSQPRSKDNKVVFVAGATGKVGSRTVRELLKLGFQVRASSRNVEKTESLLENVSQKAPADAEPEDKSLFAIFSPAKLFGFLKPKPGKMLEIVECDLENAESIEPALGNAGVVVCCIGASEKEVLDVTGPYRIDFKATQNLIDAACAAQINHFVLLTSLGTQKFGFPAAVLNLFWGVLVWKAKAENALIQSGLPYTIVRPGGMERPTDAYKETHNLTLAEADKLFGGQVSNLQVAELIATIVENPDVSINKIVEAVAETTAPLRPIKELLEDIPASMQMSPSVEPRSTKKVRPRKVDVSAQKVDKKQEEEKLVEEKRIQVQKDKEDRRIQAQKDEEDRRIQAQKDEEERLKLKALREKYEKEIQAAKEKEEAAKTAAEAALAEKAEFARRAAEIRVKAEAAALAASQAKALEAAVLAAARKGNVISDEEKQKILESVKLEKLQKVKSPETSKVSSKKKPALSFFGGLAPSTTVSETDTEAASSGATAAKKEKERADAEAKAKADEEAAAKLAEKKQLEEKEKKKEEANKLAEQEAARALEAKIKEEQEKAEKEAKEVAEQEAAKAAEAKVKEEEERAEAKRKEEEERAEAKRKEEQERAEARKEEERAEAKRKEEEERAEAKRKEEQERAEARKEEERAEAKRKEEEERAEAKRKEEQEKAEKLKEEAEKEAKVLAEQEAAAQAAAAAAAEAEKFEKEKAEQEEKRAKELAEASAPAPRKGFRWFWQPAEPEPSELEPSAKATLTGVADVPVDAKETELPPSSTPLSPYTRFPGLKPPSSPSPSPPALTSETVTLPKADLVSSAEVTSVELNQEKVAQLDGDAEKGKEAVAEEASEESKEDIEAKKLLVQEIAAREKEALEKAKAATAFVWPWQTPKPVEEQSAPPSYQARKPESETLPASSRPLSPYTQFPNLKPPSPPIPSPPVLNTFVKEPKAVETLSSSSTPLSPYPGFPDLKPPTSPAPLPSETSENGAVPEESAGTDEKILEPSVNFGFKWPWQ